MKPIKKTIRALLLAISISATPAAGGIPTAMKHKSNIKRSISINTSLLTTFHVTSESDLTKVITFFEKIESELSSIIQTLNDAEGYTFGSKTGVEKREEARKVKERVSNLIVSLKEIQKTDKLEDKLEKTAKKISSLWSIKKTIAKIKQEKEMIKDLKKDGLDVHELEARFDSALRTFTLKINQFKQHASQKELEKLEKQLGHLPRDTSVALN